MKPSLFKRTTPHECQQCGLCCQSSGDLWNNKDEWDDGIEPDDCTAFDHETKQCTAYPDRRDFCKDYPWDEWCERELKEKGLWEKYCDGKEIAE